MPCQSTMLRILGLVGVVCLGGYALAVAQPNPAPPAATASDATEESPLLIEPKTPEEIFDAAILTERLARPALAKRYLEKLLETNPTDEVLLALRDQHGPGVFLRLSNDVALRPASTQLLERVSAAFRKRAVDPKYIDEILKALNGTSQEREVAQSVLHSTGPIAVPRILQHIATPSPDDQHQVLVQALINMGKQTVPALLGALDAPGDATRSAAAETLGFLKSRDALPYLWHPAFAPKEQPGVQVSARTAIGRILGITPDQVAETKSVGAARELSNIAARHFRRDIEWPVRDDGTVESWVWSDDLKAIASKAISPEEASLRTGLRFARQAMELAPESPEYQSQYLALNLANTRHDIGPEAPLPTGPGSVHDLALTAGAETVSAALSHAIRARNSAAAQAALQILGEVGTPHQLYIRHSSESPILSALNYPDRQVQFAAAATILKLDPVNRFRGSERVVSILARALLDSGTARSVVVDPNTDRASSTAGLVGQMGYEPEIASTGKDGFKIATEHQDIELIFLEVNTIRWPLSATIANLRADARSANIPIVVYGPESVKHDVEPMLSRYPLMTYMIESNTLEGMSIQLRSFLDSLKSPALTPTQRAEQSAIAARGLAQIAESQRTAIYDLGPTEKALTRALNSAPLSHDVLTALAAIPSVSAQEQLQEFASSERIDNPTRVFTARQLTKHIRRYGLLLSLERVADLETNWRNATDPEVATALATVVGLFKPNPQRVGGRLQRFIGGESAAPAEAPADPQAAPPQPAAPAPAAP
ncbi:MAG: HEAT repeat domain-containing protein [Planctomycetaceae bacterium]